VFSNQWKNLTKETLANPVSPQNGRYLEI